MENNDIVEGAKKYLEDEGNYMQNGDMKDMDKLKNFIIPSLKASKDTASMIYAYQPGQKSGFVGKLKNMVLGKLKNIAVSVVEKQAVKQQKFNELTYQAIEILLKEVENKDK